jgi:hypothetical protein
MDLYLHIILCPGGPDECQVAADIYQCGRDVNPTVTDDIFTRLKSNATMVRFFNCFLFSPTLLFYLFFTFYPMLGRARGASSLFWQLKH